MNARRSLGRTREGTEGSRPAPLVGYNGLYLALPNGFIRSKQRRKPGFNMNRHHPRVAGETDATPSRECVHVDYLCSGLSAEHNQNGCR